MKCKKCGDIGSETLVFDFSVIPVIANTNPPIELPVQTDKTIICLHCLAKFLSKKIGICTD